MIKKWNRRQRLVLWLVLSLIFLAAVCIGGMFCGDAARETDPIFNCVYRMKFGCCHVFVTILYV